VGGRDYRKQTGKKKKYFYPMEEKQEKIRHEKILIPPLPSE
jgi:hypothetical protein